MCLVLYLGSDRQRPLIPWDDSAPRFHVKDDDADAKKVAPHLTKRTVYYVGSDNGCGCGFRQEHHEYIDDAEQLTAQKDNHDRLHQYVADCLGDEDSIQLYSCWSGDEALPAEHQRTVSVAELLSEDFWFAERQRTVVLRGDDAAPPRGNHTVT